MLLLNISLRTSLLRLARIMLFLSLQLRLAVSSHTCDSTTDSTSDTVRDAGAEVVELALSFLALTGSVLFLS